MSRNYDSRTGRPLDDGHEAFKSLTDDELEAELTVAAAEPQRRAERLDRLLLERTRRKLDRRRVHV